MSGEEGRKEGGSGKKKASLLLPEPKNVGKCTKERGRGGGLGLDKRKCYYCKVPWQKKEEGEGDDDDARFPFFFAQLAKIYTEEEIDPAILLHATLHGNIVVAR